ncbi:MAG: hypothetical protein JWN14_2332 [Chthonomonadales bacterium]|nr:hypothetical protein [Chthonomonadales bacterium]
MSLRKPDFTHMMQRLEAAFSLTLPAANLRECSDEIATSENGFLDADISSLSIALYQMGLCKHIPNPASKPTVTPIA